MPLNTSKMKKNNDAKLNRKALNMNGVISAIVTLIADVANPHMAATRNSASSVLIFDTDVFILVSFQDESLIIGFKLLRKTTQDPRKSD